MIIPKIKNIYFLIHARGHHFQSLELRSFLNSCLKRQLSHRKLSKSKTWSETGQNKSDFNKNLHASRYIWNPNFDQIWGHGDLFLEVLWRIFDFSFFLIFPKNLRQLFRNDCKISKKFQNYIFQKFIKTKFSKKNLCLNENCQNRKHGPKLVKQIGFQPEFACK